MIKFIYSMALILILSITPVFGEPKSILVSAASSLTQVFTEIGTEFEKKHAIRVFFNFGASGMLLQQIENGAPADVFASADQENVDKGIEKNVLDVSTRKNFVKNNLVLIVPKDNVLNLKSIADLKKEEVLKIALGNPITVPAGRYTKGLLEKEGLYSLLEKKYIPGENARQVLEYVVRGEVDAGFVYKTDAALFQDKIQVIVADLSPKPILYPIVSVLKTPNPKETKLFIDFLSSPEALKLFQKYQFGRP
ncbi:molybdate ABC transporter substrate-binding protein [Leptospira sp. WS92.C1]